MKKGINLIPLNNDLNKLVAFVPSLDKDWRNNQRINSKTNMVESIDAVREFQRQGWNVAGAYEVRGSGRKIGSHFIRMEHPDFSIKNSKGKTEAIATMNISNSCTGAQPMELDLGAYRQVCSNGLIAHTSYSNEKVPHTEKGQYSLQENEQLEQPKQPEQHPERVENTITEFTTRRWNKGVFMQRQKHIFKKVL